MSGPYRLVAAAAALALALAAEGPAAGQAASQAAPAASFDCARASAGVERMICADSELRALDRGIALFHASGLRNARPARAVREQRQWLTMRDGCDTRPCLREAMIERLWNLSEAVGPDLPAYTDADADSELVVADLGDGWYAFGAVGYYYGPTINSASAAGAVRLRGERGEVASAWEGGCPFTLTRLPGDSWRLEAHPAQEDQSCGGMNATVEGIYRRNQR